MKLRILIVILVSVFSAFGQKSVASLNPKHAAALKQFLSKNTQYRFLPETAFDKESLKEAKKYYGKTLTPYYKVGDFNGDGVSDFALILSKNVPPRKERDVTSEPHMYAYRLAIVIFNGDKKGAFRNAFVEELEAPLVCFLDLSGGKRKRLAFGVFQTDWNFIMTPVGKSYRVENEGEL